MVFLGENRRAIQEIMDAYPANPRFLLPILQDIQHTERHLSTDAMKAVARYLDVPDSKVYAVATFYKSLSLTPKGEVEIKVCLGTACHLRGAGEIVRGLEGALGVKAGETTADGKFSLETVNCLGACALAPVVMTGETVRGGMSAAQILEAAGAKS